ncbi:putative hmg box protein [Eutypa lata UCREL1]|uniref:Putative hmg box protein n=1 Tax=Eutypa lata (strain UCR-EL1) TaxID=1287681 RepID=M7TGV1_EUTLA|nr:putative hmg box protein [Eutypa lata UCREL1]
MTDDDSNKGNDNGNGEKNSNTTNANGHGNDESHQQQQQQHNPPPYTPRPESQPQAQSLHSYPYPHPYPYPYTPHPHTYEPISLSQPQLQPQPQPRPLHIPTGAASSSSSTTTSNKKRRHDDEDNAAGHEDNHHHYRIGDHQHQQDGEHEQERDDEHQPHPYRHQHHDNNNNNNNNNNTAPAGLLGQKRNRTSPPPPPTTETQEGAKRRRTEAENNSGDASAAGLWGDVATTAVPAPLGSAGSIGPGKELICLCTKAPKVPRPRNAFILYRQHHQAQVAAEHPGLANPEISKLIGEQWREQPDDVKASWKRLAEEEKVRHRHQFPDYRYQPRRGGNKQNANGVSGSHNSGNARPVSANGEDPGRCLKCGGRYITTPRTPSTPFAAAAAGMMTPVSARSGGGGGSAGLPPPYGSGNPNAHHPLLNPSGARIVEAAAAAGMDSYHHPNGMPPSYNSRRGSTASMLSSTDGHGRRYTQPHLRDIEEEYVAGQGSPTAMGAVPNKRRRYNNGPYPPTPASPPPMGYVPADRGCIQINSSINNSNSIDRQVVAAAFRLTTPTTNTLFPLTHSNNNSINSSNLSSMDMEAIHTCSSLFHYNGHRCHTTNLAERMQASTSHFACRHCRPRFRTHRHLRLGWQVVGLGIVGGGGGPPGPLRPQQQQQHHPAAYQSQHQQQHQQQQLQQQKQDQQLQLQQSPRMSLRWSFLSKLDILRAISPPLKTSGSEARGPLIVVEGAVPFMLKEVTTVIKKALSISGECAVKVWSESEESNPAEQGNGTDPGSSGNSEKKNEIANDEKEGERFTSPIAKYMARMLKWHKTSGELVRYMTTHPSNINTSTGASIGNGAKEKESGSSAEKGPSEGDSTTSNPPPPPYTHTYGDQKLLPVAVVSDGYSLTASDKWAGALPINDAYRSDDHWRWVATLWRGIVGADLTVYVKPIAPTAGGDEEMRPATVEFANAEHSVLILHVVDDGRGRDGGGAGAAAGGGMDEKLERRLGFEIMEWVRSGGFKAEGAAYATPTAAANLGGVRRS